MFGVLSGQILFGTKLHWITLGQNFFRSLLLAQTWPSFAEFEITPFSGNGRYESINSSGCLWLSNVFFAIEVVSRIFVLTIDLFLNGSV